MRKSLAPLLILLFLTSLVTLQPVSSATAELSWNAQTVKEYVWAGGYCPIAVDQNSTVNIAYLDGYTLTYASYNGSVWTNQSIATDAIYLIFSLVLDANGYPHLLYEQKDAGPLTLANWNGKNWSIQDTGVFYTDFATLALDSFGNPHLAYTTYTTVINDHEDWAKNSINTALKYARWTGTGWNTQTVDSIVNGSFSTISVALNKNNMPYILYSPSSNSSNIELATYQNSSWNIQNVPFPALGDFGNVVLDSKGYPHFIYAHPYQNSSTLSTILYASSNLTTWNTQIVVSGVNLGTIGELVLDSNDYPHFTIGTSAGDTMYVVNSGSIWNIQTLDSNIEVGNLALDSSGNPHIICRAYSPARYSSKLMYATATETTQTPSPTVPTFPLVLTLTAVIIATIVAVVGLLVYFKKRNVKN
jgi:hypothetical protein